MKKIAIPIANNKLSSHFGHCEHFFFIEVNNNNEITNEEILIPPEHQPGTYPNWLAENGITDVIAGGLGQRAIDILNEKGVNVFVGAGVDEPMSIAKNFLNGTLTTQANMCDH